MNSKEIAAIRNRLKQLDAEKVELEKRLTTLLGTSDSENEKQQPSGSVTNHSSTSDKIALFRSLFLGREDVFPKRWENIRTGKSGYAPACGNEWRAGVCGKPKVKCGECPNQNFLRVTDEVIDGHLRGHQTIGVYPMLADATCRFLAVDFDKKSWQRDAQGFMTTCRLQRIPSALERSRSGEGGHVWIFFAAPVPVPFARRLGTYLLTETMQRNPDLGFESYDRLFPSQDTMPAGGFGNLIALPLQHGPRQQGNSVFLDENLEPYPDQWAFLSSLDRLPPKQAKVIVEDAAKHDHVTGLRLPLNEDDEEPWNVSPAHSKLTTEITASLPERLDVVLGNQIYIPRASLPSELINRLIRLAAFQNPAFYRNQALRLSTFGIPRVIACAQLLSRHIALPRGVKDEMEQLFKELGMHACLRDERYSGRSISTAFVGSLRKEQQAAADALLPHDTGVLAATTAFGKTVVAAFIIAARKTNTLILVHRRQLMEQWVTRLGTFLDLPASSIGQIGGGKRKPGGIVDVAVLQSLVRKGEVNDIVANYGQIVVDGGMRVKQRREVMQRFEETTEREERVLIATGRYIGEGFDDARLDTLFLAMPISWKGALAQYVGRLHRSHPEKREVLVYDYVDNAVPVLRRMSEKRVRGYKAIGYFVEDAI